MVLFFNDCGSSSLITGQEDPVIWNLGSQTNCKKAYAAPGTTHYLEITRDGESMVPLEGYQSRFLSSSQRTPLFAFNSAWNCSHSHSFNRSRIEMPNTGKGCAYSFPLCHTHQLPITTSSLGEWGLYLRVLSKTALQSICWKEAHRHIPLLETVSRFHLLTSPGWKSPLEIQIFKFKRQLPLWFQ